MLVQNGHVVHAQNYTDDVVQLEFASVIYE